MITVYSQFPTLSHWILFLSAAQPGQSGRKAVPLAADPDLLTTAEYHGLALLLYTHLREAEDRPASYIMQGLQALYLRHRHANQVRTRVLIDILTHFRGWPRYSLAQQRHKSRRQIIGDTLWPSEWWLGLYYGLRRKSALLWYRWLGHPLRMMGWIGQLLLERLSRQNLRRIFM